MKKGSLILVCILIFVLLAGGGSAWLYFSPTGVLNPAGPAEVMQEYMDSMDRAAWREEFCRLHETEVTEFEDGEAITAQLFDGLEAGAPFTFREYRGVSTAKAPVYLISAGDRDLFIASLTRGQGAWSAPVLEAPAKFLLPETRTITVTVPSDTAVTLNGRPLSPRYISQKDVPYEDLTALEGRFDTVPHRVEYTVEGLCTNAVAEASREDGIVLLSSDGSAWSYTVPDAGAYSFRIIAPPEAVVTVCGAQLGEAETESASYSPEFLVTVPEGIPLPQYTVYAAEGLYTAPEITAALPDGTSLTGQTSPDGSMLFLAPGSLTLAEEHGPTVEAFLRELCEYGAGHTGRAYPQKYAVPGSEVYNYMQNASGSLIWMRGVEVEFQEVSTSDYLSLGDTCFLCHGHVECLTHTRYQEKQLSLDYEMLWELVEGQWVIQDLAFR